MKLIDLEPRWIGPDTFAFRCPHCQRTWLSCTLAQVPHSVQMEAARVAMQAEQAGSRVVVLCKPEQAWKAKDGIRDFAIMTITPSIDASASGHWHGFITNGEIR